MLIYPIGHGTNIICQFKMFQKFYYYHSCFFQGFQHHEQAMLRTIIFPETTLKFR